MSIKIALFEKSTVLSVSKSGKLEGGLGKSFTKEVFYPRNFVFTEASNLNGTFADALANQLDLIDNIHTTSK